MTNPYPPQQRIYTPQPYGTIPPQPQKKPLHKRFVFWSIVTLAILLIAAAGIALASKVSTTSEEDTFAWEDIMDQARFIRSIDEGCSELDTLGTVGLCGTGDNRYMFALNLGEHPKAASALKDLTLDHSRIDQSVVYEGHYTIVCQGDNHRENCTALMDRLPNAEGASVTASPAEPSESETPESEETGPATSFSDGTHVVGTDIEPGTYRSAGPSSCYWARLSGFGGTTSDILANGNPRGQAIVTIESEDKAFTSKRCGTWELME